MTGPLTPDDAESAVDAVFDRVDETLNDITDFPFVADPATGEWDTTEDGNWCGGHWIGLLWLAYRHRGDDRYRTAALEYLERMRQSEDLEGSMFAGMNYLYAGFRGYDVTGDRELFGAGLTGADRIVDLHHPMARMIPIGDYDIEGGSEQFEMAEDTDDRPSGASITAVDMIYTSVPVLWRAYRETGDPRFRDVAVSHCDRHLDWAICEDGSTHQEIIFDPATGEVVRKFNGLAHSDETCWARGQGWNIAGLARAISETAAERYVDALELTLGYYVDNSPADLVPYWDFEAPNIPEEPRDTSAAALTAYGLTRLDGSDDRIEEFRSIGEELLVNLVDDYLVTAEDDPRRGMVLHGTYDRPGDYGIDSELIWTDYYLAYALSERADEATA